MMNRVNVTLERPLNETLLAVLKGALDPEMSVGGTEVLTSIQFCLKNLSTFGASVTGVILLMFFHFRRFHQFSACWAL